MKLNLKHKTNVKYYIWLFIFLTYIPSCHLTAIVLYFCLSVMESNIMHSIKHEEMGVHVRTGYLSPCGDPIIGVPQTKPHPNNNPNISPMTIVCTTGFYHWPVQYIIHVWSNWTSNRWIAIVIRTSDHFTDSAFLTFSPNINVDKFKPRCH